MKPFIATFALVCCFTCGSLVTVISTNPGTSNGEKLSSDGPGAGGGYDKVCCSDGPGAGGGYDKVCCSDGPGVGGGYFS